MKRGTFVIAAETEREKLSWGQLAWLSRPSSTKAKTLTILEATLAEGGGHDFHHHPEQEEYIYILEGQVEQWLEGERRILTAGDGIFIPAGVVHATFNPFPAQARTLAVLGPCKGELGYEAVDVSAESPWKTQRRLH